MRILFWSTAFLPTLGGAEVLGFELARALQERGHEVRVMTNLPAGSDLAVEAPLDGVPVHRLPLIAPVVRADPGGIVRVKQAVSRYKAEFAPDVVHVLLLGVDLLMHRLTARTHPAPEVVTLQQPVELIDLRPKSPVGATLGAARSLVAPSEATLGLWRAALPGIEARSSVILNSFPFPPVEPGPPPAGTLRLVCAGRLEVQKGLDLALGAFARLRAERPSLRLVVAGDGPARPALEMQAAALGLADVVEFRCWVAPAEVPRLLQSATVVVMPSRDHELFGLVALQAAQVARPIVASCLGGLREVVVDGITGLLVPPDDEHALAQSIGTLLETPNGRLRWAGQHTAVRSASSSRGTFSSTPTKRCMSRHSLRRRPRTRRNLGRGRKSPCQYTPPHTPLARPCGSIGRPVMSS